MKIVFDKKGLERLLTNSFSRVLSPLMKKIIAYVEAKIKYEASCHEEVNHCYDSPSREERRRVETAEKELIGFPHTI